MISTKSVYVWVGGRKGRGERGHACSGTHTLGIGGLVANTFLYTATHLEDHNYSSALVQ